MLEASSSVSLDHQKNRKKQLEEQAKDHGLGTVQRSYVPDLTPHTLSPWRALPGRMMRLAGLLPGYLSLRENIGAVPTVRAESADLNFRNSCTPITRLAWYWTLLLWRVLRFFFFHPPKI